MIIRACCNPSCGETKGTEQLTKEQVAEATRFLGKPISDGCPRCRKLYDELAVIRLKLSGKFENKKKAPAADGGQVQAAGAPAVLPAPPAPKTPAAPPQNNAKTAASDALPKVPPAKRTPEEIAAAVASAHAKNGSASAPQGGGAPAESFREEGSGEDAGSDGETGA